MEVYGCNTNQNQFRGHILDRFSVKGATYKVMLKNKQWHHINLNVKGVN